MTAARGTDATPRTRVSAVLLTLNEELLLARCLRSLAPVIDEIVVVDAGSTDRTREIAREHGARVVEQPWLGWIGQRAVGIASAAHDWVFVIEADEIVTPALASSMRQVCAGAMDPNDGYSLDRRDDFLGVLLPSMRRRSKRINFIRLFNRTKSRYDPSRIIHDEVRIPGRAIPLPGVLIHWRGFTIAQQVAGYTRYAPLEAQLLLSQAQRVSVASLLVRPVLRFGWCYVVCGGFRLGARGFAHALMVASSEYLRFAAAWERQHAPAVLHPTPDVARALLSTSDTVAVNTVVPVTSPTATRTTVPISDRVR